MNNAGELGLRNKVVFIKMVKQFERVLFAGQGIDSNKYLQWTVASITCGTVHSILHVQRLYFLT